MINHAIALACLCCARTALKNDGACPGLSLKNRFIGAIVTLVKKGVNNVHTALEEGQDDTDDSFLGDQFQGRAVVRAEAITGACARCQESGCGWRVDVNGC